MGISKICYYDTSYGIDKMFIIYILFVSVGHINCWIYEKKNCCIINLLLYHLSD